MAGHGEGRGMRSGSSHRAASSGNHATCGMRIRTCAQDVGRPSCVKHTKTPPSPLEPGTSGVGPWYHPCLPRAHALRPCLHGAGNDADAMQWPCNGSRRFRRTVPSPPTASGEGSGRSSRVFFAGIPEPASQQPRFSVSTLPGTRPCHRQWLSLRCGSIRIPSGDGMQPSNLCASVGTPVPFVNPCGRYAGVWSITAAALPPRRYRSGHAIRPLAFD